MRRHWSMVLALAVLGAMAGCGGPDRPMTVPVSGIVRYAGQPVAGADVVFQPQQGPMATGQTDEQGRFQLMTFQPGDGAVPGEYAVMISKKEAVVDPRQPENPYPQVRDVLPPRYGNATQSRLTVRVQAAQRNDFPFDLQP